MSSIPSLVAFWPSATSSDGVRPATSIRGYRENGRQPRIAKAISGRGSLSVVQHLPPRFGRAAPGGLVRRVEGHVDVVIDVEKQRHRRERLADGDVLDVGFDRFVGDIRAEG